MANDEHTSLVNGFADTVVDKVPIYHPTYSPLHWTVDLYSLPRSMIKTQKAQGVVFLLQSGYPGLKGMEEDFVQLLPYNSPRSAGVYKSTPFFARPCPITPRHGFVESRVVLSFDEAVLVLNEARRVDPEAEVILMPRLTGQFSGIATNAGVTWGNQNDGVTSGGKGKTILIPTPVTSTSQWIKATKAKALGIKGTGYIELVEDKGKVTPVQYRDGPEQPTTRNYIPRETTITTILRPTSCPDLLKWEALIKEHEGKPGVVVAMYGEALSSHYAVHAIAHGIPVLTTIHAEYWKVIKPTPNLLVELTDEDYHNLAWMMKDWVTRKIHIQSDYNAATLATAIASIHAMTAWDNSTALLSLRAFAFPALVRHISAATLGELRHWYGNGPGTRKGADPETNLRQLFPSSEYTQARHTVYSLAFDLKWQDIKDTLQTSMRDFRHKGWANRASAKILRCQCNACKAHNKKALTGRLSYGYGGPKWSVVSEAGLELATAVDTFIARPGKETFRHLLLVGNRAVHTVHNGGYSLNKWIGESDFTAIAMAPAVGFMNDVAGRLALGPEFYSPRIKVMGER